MPILLFNSKRCIRCGACIDACPNTVANFSANTIPAAEQVDDCVSCGYCVLVCPVNAISYSHTDDTQSSEHIAKTRFLPRFSKHLPDKTILDSIALAACQCSTAYNSIGLRALFVTDKTQIDNLANAGLAILQQKGINKPGVWVRNWWRLTNQARLKAYDYYMHSYQSMQQQGRQFPILGKAPALLLFYLKGTTSYKPPEFDINRAVLEAEKVLSSFGLASITCKLFKGLANKNITLKHMLGLNKQDELHEILAVGYSANKYNKLVPRKAGHACLRQFSKG